MASKVTQALNKMSDTIPTIDDSEMDDMQLKRKKITDRKAKEGVKSGMIWEEADLSIGDEEDLLSQI